MKSFFPINTKASAAFWAMCLLVFLSASLRLGARDFNTNEKQRMFNSFREVPFTQKSVDVSLTKKVIHSLPYTVKRLKSNEKKAKELRAKLGDPTITIGTAGYIDEDGREVLLSDIRVRIDKGKYRGDIIYYGNEERTIIKNEEVLVRKPDTSFKIDKKTKKVEFSKEPYGAEIDVPIYGRTGRFGSVYKDCIYLNRSDANGVYRQSERVFKYKGSTIKFGNRADLIELYDSEKNKPEYSLVVDVNDWNKCYEIKWYNETGDRIKKSMQFADFIPTEPLGEIYPTSIKKEYFDGNGELEKEEILTINNIKIGAPSKDEVFELQENENDYEIVDRRFNPPLRIPRKK